MLKKQTEFGDLCEDANGDKLCPTKKELLLNAMKDKDQIEAFIDLKKSYNSEPKLKKEALCQLQYQINGFPHLMSRLQNQS